MTMTRILRRNCQNLNLAGHQNLQAGMVNQESKKDHERGSSLMPKCSEGIGGPAPRNNGVEGFHPVCNLAIIAICKTTYHHVNIEKWNLVVYGGLAAQSKTDPTPTDLQWQSNRFSNPGL